MNIDYADLIPDIARRLKGDPSEPVMIATIRETFTDICRRTQVWTFTPDPVNVVADETMYPIERPNGARFYRLRWAAFRGARLTPVTGTYLNERRPTWQTDRGNPRFYAVIDFDQLAITPAPENDQDEALTYEVALIPSADSDTAPEGVIETCRAAITHGVLERLMANPNQLWTDLQVAAYHANDFAKAVAAIQGLMNQGVARRVMRTTPVY